MNISIICPENIRENSLTGPNHRYGQTDPNRRTHRRSDPEESGPTPRRTQSVSRTFGLHQTSSDPSHLPMWQAGCLLLKAAVGSLQAVGCLELPFPPDFLLSLGSLRSNDPRSDARPAVRVGAVSGLAISEDGMMLYWSEPHRAPQPALSIGWSSDPSRYL